MLRASGGPSILKELSDEGIAVGIEDAVRMNVAAVTVQVFVGGVHETHSMHNMTRLVDAGLAFRHPGTGVTAVGKELTRDAVSPAGQPYLRELGAQMVKTYYCADGFDTVTACVPSAGRHGGRQEVARAGCPDDGPQRRRQEGRPASTWAAISSRPSPGGHAPGRGPGGARIATPRRASSTSLPRSPPEPCRWRLVNRTLGLRGVPEVFRIDQLPHHTVWRMLGEGTYACGLEPSTNRDAGRFDARERGELQWLEPGETRQYDLEIGALGGLDAISGFAARVSRLTGGHGEPRRLANQSRTGGDLAMTTLTLPARVTLREFDEIFESVKNWGRWGRRRRARDAELHDARDGAGGGGSGPVRAAAPRWRSR